MKFEYFASNNLVPLLLFDSLPKKIRRRMIRNIVWVKNNTDTVLQNGDPWQPIAEQWCQENATSLYCVDENYIMFESATDMTLFLTARPQE